LAPFVVREAAVERVVVVVVLAAVAAVDDAVLAAVAAVVDDVFVAGDADELAVFDSVFFVAVLAVRPKNFTISLCSCAGAHAPCALMRGASCALLS
jgi:hypothetical protein